MDSKSPKVSIITPAYNSQDFLEQTIHSVCTQTYSNWELLIIDDGSKDATVEIARSFANKDQRIKIIDLKKNIGPALARNVGLEQATGRFVAFLDSDDLWASDKLEKQVSFMMKLGCALSFSAYQRINAQNECVGEVVAVPSSVSYQSLLTHNVIGCLTAMVDTHQTGPVRMVNAGYDDFILWLEILKKGFIAHALPEPLAFYRVVEGSVSSKKLRSARWVWTIYRNVERFSFMASAWYFGQYCLLVNFKHLRFYRQRRKIDGCTASAFQS